MMIKTQVERLNLGEDEKNFPSKIIKQGPYSSKLIPSAMQMSCQLILDKFDFTGFVILQTICGNESRYVFCCLISYIDGHSEAEFGMSWCAGFGGSFYSSYFEVMMLSAFWC